MSLADMYTWSDVPTLAPPEAPARPALRPHAKVVVSVSDGAVVIRPLPEDGWRGVGRELADGTDATDYVKKLRAEWESGR